MEIPLIGLQAERRLLMEAAARRESLLILGPAGSGKTRLLREVMRAHRAFYTVCPPVLHRLLTSLATALADARRPGFCVAGGGRFSGQTSIRLKGLIWQAFELEPGALLLDGIDGAGFPTYRFLQRLYHTPGMVLLAAARDPRRLGALSRLFWDPRRILQIHPLKDREALQLFEQCADIFRLRDLDLDDFRPKVLASAGGNPGQIVEMCRLATNPQYLKGSRVKFTPLRIDTVIRFAG